MLTGGDHASIADLLCAATLDQTKEAGMRLSAKIWDKIFILYVPANYLDQIFMLQVLTMQQILTTWRG